MSTEAQQKAFPYRKIALTVLDNTLRHKQAAAGSGVYPGHLVGAGNLLPITGMPKYAILVAEEQGEQGKTIHDAITAGEQFDAIAPTRGSIVLLRVRNGEDVDAGDLLEPDGAGCVKVASSSSMDCALGYAVGSCDMSGSSGVDPVNLVPVYIL